MKKSFLYPVMALFVCLFAACSQEEIVSDGELGSNKVRLSVKIPAVGPVSRAADLTVEGYVMRCIMELVDDKGAVIADSHQTVAVKDGRASFEFTKPSGAYTCLFWADYVKGTDIKATTATIYNAANLLAVDFRLNKTNDLFNNKAADAFCGKLASTAISSGQNVTLKRPFTRIAISKADLAIVNNQLNTFTANIKGAQGYNIATGKTTTTQTLGTATGTSVTFPTDGETAFSCYVFPANDAVGSADFKFTKDGDVTTEKRISITADQMKEMKTNTAVNLVPKEEGTPGEPGDGNIKVEIEIDNNFENGGGTTDPEPEEPTDPETPAGAAKVGDYFYSDGTCGASATKSGVTTVGVVFDLAEGDAIANYNGVTFADGKVHGWVISISQSVKTAWTAETLSAPIEGMTSSATQDDILGYKNTKAAGTQTATTLCTATGATLTSTSTSGWYIPAIGQLAKLVENVSIVNTKLGAVTDATLIPPTGTSVDMNFWSSTFNGGTGDATKIFQYQYKPSDGSLKARSEKPGSNAGMIRPVLTF